MEVVRHGSHPLIAMTAANSTTSQPGCSRIMIGTLARLCHRSRDARREDFALAAQRPSFSAFLRRTRGYRPLWVALHRMRGHTIVCGDDALAVRIVEELNNAGTSVVMLSSAAELADAGVAAATAVICVADDDATNLEIALLAREANPTVRVVARLANSVLREAVAAGNGPGAVLDGADLAAPSVVDACLARTTNTFDAAGIRV